jgi:hypothetical protein
MSLSFGACRLASAPLTHGDDAEGGVRLVCGMSAHWALFADPGRMVAVTDKGSS